MCNLAHAVACVVTDCSDCQGWHCCSLDRAAEHVQASAKLFKFQTGPLHGVQGCWQVCVDHLQQHICIFVMLHQL